MKNDFIDIVHKCHTKNEYGVAKKSEEIIHDIPCEVRSASANEWFEGGRMGLNPDYTFIINRLDYNNEMTVIYNDVRYAVYRTYVNGDDIELHAQREKGA